MICGGLNLRGKEYLYGREAVLQHHYTPSTPLMQASGMAFTNTGAL